MPTNTLVGELANLTQLVRPTTNQRIRYEPLQPKHREQVADLYHVSYPAHVGAATIDEALAEMDATYARRVRTRHLRRVRGCPPR